MEEICIERVTILVRVVYDLLELDQCYGIFKVRCWVKIRIKGSFGTLITLMML